jgi:hypothetical protein
MEEVQASFPHPSCGSKWLPSFQPACIPQPISHSPHVNLENGDNHVPLKLWLSAYKTTQRIRILKWGEVHSIW